MLSKTMHFLLMIFFIYVNLTNISCQTSFLLAFQKTKGRSASEWAEYDDKISHLKAFTGCHWERIQFFNLKNHYIWNYCTIKSSTDKMVCMQISAKRNIASIGRDILVLVSFGKENNKELKIKPFMPRTWNHFCWSYNSFSGENRIYVNGKFHGNAFFDIKREALGSDEVYGSSFSIGQDPDEFRGKYDESQAFRGNIS